MTSCIDFHRWSSRGDFESGVCEGTGVTSEGGLVLTAPAGTAEYTDPALQATTPYEYGQWTSPVHVPGFPATELVASWNATTPPGTWLEVAMRGRGRSGMQTSWYVMGRWAYGDGDIHRTSVPGQADAGGDVDVDTFRATAAGALAGYQLRVTLYRLSGTTGSPRLSMVGAMTSALPSRMEAPVSVPRRGAAVELAVPRYSQEVHTGHAPQYGNGGEAWCSPASTEMVVEYWGRGPAREELAWVDAACPDPQVDHAARMTYDHAYRGTGNWSFNAAYAAHYGLHAQVTRLHSLGDLERFIEHGIPVITSQSFHAGELDGAGYDSAGHLMVVVGLTDAGDVIVQDPAAPGDDAVRRVYDRRQFENVWLRTERISRDGAVARGSGGIVYLLWPPGVTLPPAPTQHPSW